MITYQSWKQFQIKSKIGWLFGRKAAVLFHWKFWKPLRCTSGERVYFGRYVRVESMTPGEIEANRIIGEGMAQVARGEITLDELRRRIASIPAADYPKQFDQQERRLLFGKPVVEDNDG